jgi:uncharacterized protein (DUF362 family)
MKKESHRKLNRREFIKHSAIGLAGLSAANFSAASPNQGGAGEFSTVALVRTGDRAQGVEKLMQMMKYPGMKGKKVFIKPNFNTADPTPGSTHNDTLAQLVREIKERGAAAVTVGDRCGPSETKKVMEDKGIFDLGSELGFEVLNFDDLEEKEWVNLKADHWPEGYFMARPVIEADYLISTCCLKTHGFGGVFTMSMKLSVGAVNRRQMRELHRSPDMRKMIAEINQGYIPRLIVMDGVVVYTDGGPMEGEQKTANVMLAGTDRVAVDAVGLAVLKELGSNEAVMGTGIFEQEQIKRAVEIGLGASGPDKIKIVASDEEGKAYADKLSSILARG